MAPRKGLISSKFRKKSQNTFIKGELRKLETLNPRFTEGSHFPVIFRDDRNNSNSLDSVEPKEHVAVRIGLQQDSNNDKTT